MPRIQHQQAGEFTRGCCGDDFISKATFTREGNGSVVIQVGRGQQQEVDAGRVKAEIISVFLVKFAAALITSRSPSGFGSWLIRSDGRSRSPRGLRSEMKIAIQPRRLRFE